MIRLRALGSEESINTLAEIMSVGDNTETRIEEHNGQFLFVFECDEMDQVSPLNARDPDYDDGITDASELSIRNGMGIVSKILDLEIEVLNEPEDEPFMSYFHLVKGTCLKHKIWNEYGESQADLEEEEEYDWNESGESEADPVEGEEYDWDKQHAMPGFEIEYDLIDLYEPPVFSIKLYPGEWTVPYK